jgi:sterol desaturase/sphingolipid hydroxylase (fatty acid hydroxylase superfamily)
MASARPQGMENLLTALIPLTFVLLLVIERLFPARPLPRVRGWLLKGIVFFVLGGALSGLLPGLITSLLGGHVPFDLRGLGTVAGGLVGFALADFVSYWTHRILHNVPALWRWTHQLHHSAERLDVAGSAYFHPFDNLLQGGVNLLALLSLGLSPEAAALAGFIGFFVGTFQHLNVRTPRWLGYVIQRPEAHSVHHARGVHAYNYGNFMLWDQLFGTFRNPEAFAEPAGFWDGASSKLGPLLLGRDVSTPP